MGDPTNPGPAELTMELSSLPDELILSVSGCLQPLELLRLHSTCRRIQSLPLDRIWRARCAERWQHYPRYALTAAREHWLEEHKPGSWLARFRFVEQDLKRTR